jgi:hypothetical protein
MPGYVFEPQVDEDEWLSTPPKRLWPMWCSMPYWEGEKGPERKKLLMVVELMRRVADQLPDSRSLAVIGVAEAFADGLIPYEQVSAAHKRAEEAYEQTPPAPRATEDAARAAARLLYEENETAEMLVSAAGSRAARLAGDGDRRAAYAAGVAAQETLIAQLIREVHGNPFRSVAFDPAWRTDTVALLARQMYDSRDFGAMPILADALQDAGCEDEAVLTHCRAEGPHIRGCWVVDGVLGLS